MDNQLQTSLRKLLKEFYGDILTEEKRQEVWLRTEDLQKQFGLSANWVKHYGKSLPRQQVAHGAWVYPRNVIQKMFWNGKIKNL